MIEMSKASRKRNILPARDFAKRMLIFFAISVSFMIISLLIGVIGYHYFAGLSWIDSFYIASMILTGMGPTSEMTSVSGKLFSSFYALFSGLVFLTTAAIFISPIAHRLLHVLHVEEIDDKDEKE
jgi:magnesium-transporting ATPase (P-type)